MAVPQRLLSHDLESLTEVSDPMSARISNPKLPLWADIPFVIPCLISVLEGRCRKRFPSISSNFLPTSAKNCDPQTLEIRAANENQQKSAKDCQQFLLA